MWSDGVSLSTYLKNITAVLGGAPQTSVDGESVSRVCCLPIETMCGHAPFGARGCGPLSRVGVPLRHANP
jgi:hypothetical protein